jgi:hypothetical protein
MCRSRDAHPCPDPVAAGRAGRYFLGLTAGLCAFGWFFGFAGAAFFGLAFGATLSSLWVKLDAANAWISSGVKLFGFLRPLAAILLIRSEVFSLSAIANSSNIDR